MQMKLFSRQRQNEQGQTIILVAISLVSLLAMAVLAIDIVTLYLASSEINAPPMPPPWLQPRQSQIPASRPCRRPTPSCRVPKLWLRTWLRRPSLAS